MSHDRPVNVSLDRFSIDFRMMCGSTELLSVNDNVYILVSISYVYDSHPLNSISFAFLNVIHAKKHSVNDSQLALFCVLNCMDYLVHTFWSDSTANLKWNRQICDWPQRSSVLRSDSYCLLLCVTADSSAPSGGLYLPCESKYTHYAIFLIPLYF